MKQRSMSLVLLTVAGAATVGWRALAAQEPSAYDRIWQEAELYDNAQNPVLQSVMLSGRLQYEYARVEDAGVTYDEWNVRRTRFGVKLGVFDELTIHLEAGFNPQERAPLYSRLTDFNVEWSRDASLAVTLGKQGVPFTMDGSTSSKELLTIDRSNLANNMWFPQEYMPGVAVSGERGVWSYHLGGYSAGAANREFGDFTGSGFGLLALGYDLAGQLGVGEAVLRGSYIYQDADPANTFTRLLQHVASLTFELEDVRWGLRTDLSAGSGYLGQSDLWGTTVMPYLTVAGALQVVTRGTYLSSADPNGVRLARYENRHTAGMGDQYRELYLGLNYFFYGHKLKVQSGVQLGDMEDAANDGGSYSGVSWATGVRVSW